MEGLKSFTSFTYKTTDGETIIATKNNGVVTLNGDKNGVRQMPLEDFKKEFVASVPKLERIPETDIVSFRREKTLEENKNPKKEASSGKKWGVGIASAFITGLGQAINGEWGKAAGFFFGGIGLPIALGFICQPLGFAVRLGIGIWSIVDSVKNAKAD